MVYNTSEQLSLSPLFLFLFSILVDVLVQHCPSPLIPWPESGRGKATIRVLRRQGLLRRASNWSRNRKRTFGSPEEKNFLVYT